MTPLQYRQTCRLLLAKKLLTDTRLSVLDVAMASGFGSLRRFNTVFEREYKLTPSALRKQAAGRTKSADSFTVEVGYRPPYRWQEMLRFLSARAIPGVETIRDDAYYRTVRIKEHIGWIRVEQQEAKNTLAVTVSTSLLRVLPQILAKVRRLFDTDSEPHTIAKALKDMRQIHETLPICGLRIPGCFDAFETCVRAILGQQITVKAATTLAGRIAQALGTPMETGIEGLTHSFPIAVEILESGIEALGELGVIRARSEAILELAERFQQGEVITRNKLLAIKGIGVWTADYIAMRVLGDTDAFLPTDYGVKTALAHDYIHYDSPLGTLTIAAEKDALIALVIEGQKYEELHLTGGGRERETPVLHQAKTWLDRYFAGERPNPAELKLSPKGTAFQQRVWQELLRIPYGRTVSYGSLAAHLGSSARAVGSAVGRNLISVIIPCHRVLGADGSLGGYAGGLENKMKLLRLEKYTNEERGEWN